MAKIENIKISSIKQSEKWKMMCYQLSARISKILGPIYVASMSGWTTYDFLLKVGLT